MRTVQVNDRLRVTAGKSCFLFPGVPFDAAEQLGSKVPRSQCTPVSCLSRMGQRLLASFQKVRAAALRCQLALHSAGFGLCVSTYAWVVFIDPRSSNLRCSRVAWWLGIGACGGAAWLHVDFHGAGGQGQPALFTGQL